VYRALLEQGIPAEQIMMGGDSAGGGLTAATLVTLRDQGLPMPRGAILLSPWTDLAGTGDSMQTRAPFDPWLEPEGIRAGAQFYVNGDNPKNPLISPVYANLEGFPPLLVFVGHDECLLDDSARLVQHAQDAGVSVTFKVWEGMWHVFVAFAAQVPEAREAIAEIGVWARSLLS
jgi:acetyl esterase/lipase